MTTLDATNRTQAARAARAAGHGGPATPWPRRRAQLRELFATHRRLSSAELAAHLGVNKNTAANSVRAAMDEGLVEKLGQGMNTEYQWVQQ
ncbi:MAG: helix-turn-helix domain-containing protein [Panacagrimonas sp.]